ncbi:LysR family transcriptional regulator [Nocardia otitidiscaviarum]|uniref:LysR family transcriptional regulator n=1 Tax=Nocardia otitidiscaviarum TaxID=1823 RepID=UPI003F6893A1
MRHLRAFVTVTEELNFGRAAARLYVSQPALIRQIRALERLVGCDLLRRTTHQVELTLAGEALLDRARRILEGVDEAVLATRAVSGELLARITRNWELFGTADAELHSMRTAYEDLHAQFPPPQDISIRPITVGGVSSLPSCPKPPMPSAPQVASSKTTPPPLTPTLVFAPVRRLRCAPVGHVQHLQQRGPVANCEFPPI